MAKRKRVRIKANELTDVDVEYLSIVKRGANRIPFRILKSEDEKMLDLSRIFFRKTEPKLPAVAAIAVADGDNAPAMIEAVKKAYEIVAEEKVEGATILKLDAEYTPSEETSVVKMSEDLAAFVVNVEKAVDTYPGALSFMENMNSAGFLPSVKLATDVMIDTMLNIVMTPGESQESTVSKVDEVLKEYRTYVMKLTKAVPSTVFKMDSDEFHQGVVEIQKGLLNSAEMQEKEQKGKAPAAAEEAPTEDTSSGEEDDSGEEKNGGAPSAEGETGETESPEGVASNVQKSQADFQTELLDKISGLFGEKIETLKTELTGTLSQMETKVGELGQTVTGLSEKVQAVEGIAKSADEAVRGTVHSDSTSPEGTGKRVAKQDRNGVFDSLLEFPGFEEV